MFDSNSFQYFYFNLIGCHKEYFKLSKFKDVKDILRRKLDKHKIPQVIKIVDQIKLTDSGKKSRKS